MSAAYCFGAADLVNSAARPQVVANKAEATSCTPAPQVCLRGINHK
jgi:hypothetical protein